MLFLKALEAYFEYEPASRATGVGRKTVYTWRQKDPEFDRACREARKPAIENLKHTTYLRALNGFDPVAGVQGEKLVDDKTAALYSMFMIKAHDPAYKDSYRPAIDVQDMKISLQIPAPSSFKPKELPAGGQVIDAEIISEEPSAG